MKLPDSTVVKQASVSQQRSTATGAGAKNAGPRVVVTVLSAKHLPSMDMWGKCDGLVEINWEGQKHATSYKKQTYDPEWNEDFSFTFDHDTMTKGISDLVLGLKDWDASSLMNYDHVGDATVRAEEIDAFVKSGEDRKIAMMADIPVKDKKGVQVRAWRLVATRGSI